MKSLVIPILCTIFIINEGKTSLSTPKVERNHSVNSRKVYLILNMGTPKLDKHNLLNNQSKGEDGLKGSRSLRGKTPPPMGNASVYEGIYFLLAGYFLRHGTIV